MSTPEKSKLDTAIMSHIFELYALTDNLKNDIFRGVVSSKNRYYGLDQVVTSAETVLKELRELLAELDKIDPQTD